MRKGLKCILASVLLCTVLTASLSAPVSAAAFQDVPAGHWAADEIQRCVEKGFFNGQSETHFGLGAKMSRAAFAVVLCRFFGWEGGTPEGSAFDDVQADAWYAGSVEAAFRNGAVTNPEGEFRPNDPITREELAVMLVRAMGYGEIAGLAQDLPMPFEDVTTNRGYIAMAYELGLVSGTTATTFAPANTATREQVGVILMRLYDKLNGADPEVIGIVSGETDLTGLDIVAIPAVKAFSLSVKAIMEESAVAAIQTAAHNAGAEAFLYMEAGAGAMTNYPEKLAPLVASAVEDGDYDGLILDVPRVSESGDAALNRLVRLVDQELGERPFYLVTEAPTRGGEAYDGYRYEMLDEFVDRFILRIPAVEEVTKSFAVDPIDPPEEICYALAVVKDAAGAEKLTLMLDSGMKRWYGGEASELSEAELQELLASEAAQVYWSDRYDCAYLMTENVPGRPVTAWYLTENGVENRIRMAKAMGVDQICISDWDCAVEALRAGVN